MSTASVHRTLRSASSNQSSKQAKIQLKLMRPLPRPIRVLILYGSLRDRSFSRLMAYEAARLLSGMACDVRMNSPRGLPLRDDDNITGIFKTIFDHIPLSTGSVRPTQGKVCAVSQVNGGSQSFNAVNTLRILGRWMRMFVIPNQASLPTAWKCFDEADRMLASSNHDRLVDVCEELVKVSALFVGKEQLFADRWSERSEKTRNAGALFTQEQKERAKGAPLLWVAY
ncbi:arsenate resistance ArsH [Tilletiaria anomala UBC 951]|uniref:Arsenate resistance ArsH n=1 Tax=Tilletiaria anomala (strain ATCC 24038 / CBS 436.72 / UBC 951) TaxID=1037660 RepID=A0A066WEL4_TILAU|nr:arsenate resistance ArsH [Tilletiaria anomala UBC 951]KDN52357.1 arsenate resistance ArsH [Tilletiaria anomala UBC 951]